jgi:hypothetical protein
MLKKINTFKIFMTAATTFLAVEMADSPLRTLSYLSVFAVAGGNFWLRLEDAVREKLY